jgi:hypothetical protein
MFPLIAALVAGVAAFFIVPVPPPEITRTEFMAEVRAGHVHKVEIHDQEVIIGESSTRGKFRTNFDRNKDANLPAELDAIGVQVLSSRSMLGV